jgi:murein hydrolase activator
VRGFVLWLGLTLLVPALSEAAPRQNPSELLREIEALEVRMLKADEELRGATIRVREAESRIAIQEKQLASNHAVLEERRERLKVRLRTMYRFRHRGFLPLLFSIKSPHELLRTARYLWWIVKADQNMMDGLKDQLRKERRGKRQITRERSLLLQAAGEAFTRRDETRALRDERKSLVEGIRQTNRQRVNKLLIQGREGDLDVRIDLREEALKQAANKTTKPAFARSRGHLPMPVVGDIKSSGRGIDILADVGDPIRSIHSGEVSKLMHINGYGLVAILDHGDDWFTVYTHAREFTVQTGEQIESGQIIGYVGETGSLEGPRLHFELRQGRKDKNPLRWLQIPRGVRVLNP